MVRALLGPLLLAATALSGVNGYFLFAMNNVITTERIDPIVSPGKVSGHVHTIVGGSNFRVSTNTSFLRKSECTSSPIKQDKSNYWAPTLYFQWKNGSFSSVNGSPVMCVVLYYLFSDTPGVTTPFPDDFRMLSGTPTLRSYNPNDFAQQAVTFLCLDFSGTSTKFNQLPSQSCPSGIRAQINFPSCWDGVNSDSPDHKSHVAFLSGGPDSGTCSDKRFPKTLPRIFMEMYLDTGSWDKFRDQAMNPNQPYVYAMGDPTGYGYHAGECYRRLYDGCPSILTIRRGARVMPLLLIRLFTDFIMGWDAGVLQNVVDKCHCDPFGDPTCCSNQGIFNFEKGGNCRITKGVDEITTGTLASLPGNNPVVGAGQTAQNLAAPVTPALISPVFAYTGDSPSQTGSPVGPATTQAPTSGGNSAGSGSGSSSSSSGSSGAGSAPPADGGSSSNSGSTSGNSSPSTGGGSSSNSGSSSSSGALPPANGGTPDKGASGPGSSNSSSNPPTCKPKHKARRSVAAGVQAHSRRRRFSTPQSRFIDHDF
ncbi:DUF1996 domain-containing protein [Mycena indigotica]|uniref:DUF1996 domain-containing protein n=1 Tax=Mycena indigotica TaxID=2126181 RepID=A0A8H6T9V8_9AGAR|nr:DUF1996 domain-containing protein [Mycena indigotica]KAF7312010.1 DUF1996 domain-containing protein [Mycena indigotica]